MKVVGPARVDARRRQGPRPPDHGEVGISESRRVRGLGANQIAALLAAVRPTPPERWPTPRRTARRRLTVLAGPTAVGKGTVAADVRARLPRGLALGLGDHPRAAPGEVDGVHYHFVDDAEFDRMVADGRAARVGGRARPHRYGTPRGAGRAGARRRAAGAARDRPAGRPPGARADARGAVRVPARRRPGTSWSAGWSAGAPRTEAERARRLATARRGAGRRGGVRRDHRQRRCTPSGRRTGIIDGTGPDA